MRKLLLTLGLGLGLILSCNNPEKIQPVRKIICINEKGDTTAIYKTKDAVRLYPRSSIRHEQYTSMFHTLDGKLMSCSTNGPNSIISIEQEE